MYPTSLRLASTACALIASLVLSACGSQSAGTSQDHIGGTVAGLAAGAKAVITDNGGDALTVTANAPFAFATPLASGSTYQVAVSTQPPGQLCTVTGGSGVVTTDVTSVAIVCASTSRTVGGTVSGLAGGTNVVISDNGGDALTLTRNAPFTFATALTIGATYQVAVTTQPAGQVCSVTGGSGTVGTNNVTSIAVQCVSNTHIVGGTVSGLAAGAKAVITDNGGDALTLTANAPFAFATPLASGSTYQVAVSTQPPGQLCTVTGGSGVVTADVTSVAIVCASTSRTVGGTVSGLAGGTNLVITDNGGDALTLTGNAPFTFATALTIGATYQVAVTTQPAGQVCSVTGGSGTVGTNNVTSIAVQCVSNTHFIGGTVSGLAAGASAVITDNGGDALTVTANAPFAFATPLASGSTYQVAIKTPPSGQACSVSGGSGTVGSANVTNVVVQCVNNTHTVGGTIAGLIGGTSGVLADNGGDLLTFTSNGPFTFATPVASGSHYHVTIVTQPAGQTCSVTNGDGTMSKINVTTVNVACATPSGNWTWEGGSSLPGAAGVYGSLGVAAPANVPGARGSAVSASDAAGNLWLFGGDLATPVGSAMYMNDLWKYSTSTQQWTWVSGSNTAMSAGSYGTQGTPAAGNAPSARNLSVSWVDGSGNLWVFGGYGCITVPDPLPGCYTSYLNDLWKYSFGSGQWTWVNGPNISSFAQSSQVNAVFGTQGVAAAANLPGGRIGAVSWTDPAGNLWLFGGRAYDAAGQTGPMNDLWKYTPGTGLWTWIGGSNNALLANAGAYGTQGVAAAGNWPGARTGATAWTDPSGNLWLFGGTCVTPVPAAIGQCNDLWKYATATGQWTWIAGANTINATGTYGTLAVAAPGNTPGARYGAAGWLDAAGNFWLMGGYGFGSVTNPVSDLNDLWLYSPASGQWRWVSGSNTSNAVGVYGTLGTGAPSNVPGSRDSMAPWIDASGNLWLFGGNGQTQTALKNDLWRYTP